MENFGEGYKTCTCDLQKIIGAATACMKIGIKWRDGTKVLSNSWGFCTVLQDFKKSIGTFLLEQVFIAL